MIRQSTTKLSIMVLVSAVALARSGLCMDQNGVRDSRQQLEDELKHQCERIAKLERLVHEQGVLLEQLQRQVAIFPEGAPKPTNRQSVGQVASTQPVRPAATAIPALLVGGAQKEPIQEPSPLSFPIGSAYLTPFGFMDFTGLWRSSAVGSGIGTSFGGIPYRDIPAGRLSEFRLSAQNSRIGSRVDAMVKGARVIGYWESDFLGFVPGNAAVSTNSDTFRLRLYWVDLRRGKWELLAGQSWSLMTPGRNGISPLPADLFYSQDIDTNYQAGLTWSRDPQLRLVFHPRAAVAAAVSFESPEQYIGGSAGGGLVTLPAALVSAYQTQLNNGTTTLGVPNRIPDVVAKVAFDPKLRSGRGLHFEVGGTARTFRVWNPSSIRFFTAEGLGIQANMNVEVLKGLRVLTNHYWSNGGGRWIFGQAPDLVVRADGSLSSVHSGSIVSGLEYTRQNTVLYGYYGGVYIGRNAALDSGGRWVGYGYPGAPPNQNRSIQEATLGLSQTFWKDARYGALTLMGQYSYVARNPWSVPAAQSRDATAHMVFMNLRYSVPGAVPTIK